MILKIPEPICIRKVNENIRLVEIGQPLTMSLKVLNTSCKFRKKFEEFDIKMRGCRNEFEKVKHRKYMKEYSQKPEIKKKNKEYQQIPEVKKRIREYNRKPEVKAKKKEYLQKPEVKERRNKYSKEYYSKSENKEKKKAYYQKHKEKIKQYMKEYSKRKNEKST